MTENTESGFDFGSLQFVKVGVPTEWPAKMYDTAPETCVLKVVTWSCFQADSCRILLAIYV